MGGEAKGQISGGNQAQKAILQYCVAWNRSFELLDLGDRLGDVWAVIAAISECLEHGESAWASDVLRHAKSYGFALRGGETLPYKFRICLNDLVKRKFVFLRDASRESHKIENEDLEGTAEELEDAAEQLITPRPELIKGLHRHALDWWGSAADRKRKFTAVTSGLSPKELQRFLIATGNRLFEFMGTDFAQSWMKFRKALIRKGFADLNENLQKRPVLWVSFAALLTLEGRVTSRDVDDAIATAGLQWDQSLAVNSLKLLPEAWREVGKRGQPDTYQIPEVLDKDYKRYLRSISTNYRAFKVELDEEVRNFLPSTHTN